MSDESDDVPDVVETARKEFFAALGEAISSWYWVELRLFYMISRLLGFKDIKAAGAAFSARRHTPRYPTVPQICKAEHR